MTKGKQTSTVKDIIQRHRVSITCNLVVKIIELGQKWGVISENKEYMVEKKSSVRCCKFYCQFCNICIHNYSCNCPDFSIKTTICKHIHYIVNISEKNTCSNSNITDSLLLNTGKTENEVAKCLDSLKNKSSVCNNDTLGKTIVNSLLVCQNKVCNVNLKNANEAVLSQMLLNIKNLESLIDLTLSKTNKNTSFKEISSTSSNKNIAKQYSFHSTKKKQSKQKQNKLPTTSEKKSIMSFLSGEDLFISHSAINDHMYTKKC